MNGSLFDSTTPESAADTRSSGRLLLGVLAALLVTGLLFGGYSVLRKRHQQTTLAQESKPVEAKGPAKAQILVDEALLKGDLTILGGTVKNISAENLASLAVDLELTRRKGGQVERTSAPVAPGQLAPQEEGRYTLQLRSEDYRGAKLVGLRSVDTSADVVFIAGPGQKRPPERLEAKTIVVGRPSSHGKNEFLNTPDTPGRVP